MVTEMITLSSGSCGPETGRGTLTNPGIANLNLAKMVVEKVFAEFEAQSLEEQEHYVKARLSPSTQKSNWWATYTDKARLRKFAADSLDFVQNHAECRMQILAASHLRFLVLLQHSVAEDISDLCMPADQRKHLDVFEGVNTQSVNSQLVKDAHRSEWSIEGRNFTLQPELADGGPSNDKHEDRRKTIANFQKDFVESLEDYLVSFCRRWKVSSAAEDLLLRAVTTQMSQCGLANLDRGSQAGKYFVSGQGLVQRTAYNLSSMETDYSMRKSEMLKLSMLCMKTGFTQYLTEDSISTTPYRGVVDALPCEHSPDDVGGPRDCSPSSYLYQYATLQFSLDSRERVKVVVLDALDEVHIEPAA
eukprot:gnl/TRDRNA2_/TRDRNA2_154131_c0_seq2.p1 gnl/TRDRNA2_/TRDRNA2_154131_c0~~gnl/TRDRNA2_/TRDRNA2_154131_c0_seq2.p1  ORF type:complete len:414 (+),score=71.33 gnl/TRDRNA2_/TRDRNA2_154131_c0_seq2:162-1244(+)